MKYSVRWSRRAINSVAQAWLDHPLERSAITEAVAAADELLAIDPVNQGESAKRIVA